VPSLVASLDSSASVATSSPDQRPRPAAGRGQRLHIIINCLYENKCTILCTVLLVPKKGGLVKVKKEIKSDLCLPDFYTTDQLLDAASQLVKLEADLLEFKSFVMGELQRHQQKVGVLLGSPPAI